jgi:two-component system, OmpR family, sensor histidine kinase SenX3
MNDALILLIGMVVGAGIALAFWFARNQRPDARMAKATNPDAEPPRVSPDPTSEVIDRLAEGVVVLDNELRPVLANAAARRMLGFQQLAGLARLPSEEVLAGARRALVEGVEIDDVVGLWFPLRLSLHVRALPLREGTGVLVLLQDVTEELLAQQVRREFVAHASHELKSPVASLQTLAEAVQQAAEDDPRSATRFAERLVTEANRLGRLIGDLLDLSRLEEPTALPQSPTSLSDIACKEAEQIRTIAESKEITFAERIQQGIWIRGDPQQLQLLVRNLLENAIRYTPDGGSVTLETSMRGSQAVITVTDTGIGIPLESQARVFERFYRVDRARSRDRGGTGLGLAIVKHVAEMHGGQVTVESELGSGSTFTAWLPAATETHRDQVAG